ncbi:MarR family transcriptional regulator (plasmid) [Halorubrum sp. BOL3-1]|uniref:MarR family transcriptional regulator n=1 Tax=Halorubrum sp. BOL3-1 TaxID=2497325 RepID=UPI001005032D|nr:MarR family transcriptional regulator [Halorubrum sp. BOL3-1]QAU11378.1 MarR family transcriptional regulator [Halorubrum sp. BOL3-1]
MPVPVDDLTDDEPFPVNPESAEYEALSFLVVHHEYGYTPQEIAVRTDLNKTTASNTMAQLVENGLVEQAEDVYYIDPRRVDELTNRLRSLDSAVELFEATPDNDSYAQEDWEQEVPSINPDEQTETSVERDSEAVKARAEALIEEVENSDLD